MGSRDHLFAAAALLLLPLFSSNPDDERCLTHLSQSLSDPLKSLHNWSATTFTSPCDGSTSFLSGATCNNGRISNLFLSNLSLTGSIPPHLSNCTALQSLDLSSNALSGPIPPDLGSLLYLAALNLSSNAFSGPIPAQLGLLVRLSAFDVSGNRLSGPVPASLGNRTGNLARFNASSFDGNKGLYGYPLPLPNKSGFPGLAIVGIGLGSGLVSLMLSFIVVCVWLRVTEQRSENDEVKITQLMPDY
ncbi:receptor-like protein 44 [Salvia splendens]|uniref:receptor-like protein 44 n=1 Tax=Salvia splendens TaxID=180675 RepID=UPI001101BEA9|nr:receptor-like protein 44 [Salvia splendens]